MEKSCCRYFLNEYINNNKQQIKNSYYHEVNTPLNIKAELNIDSVG